MTTKLYPFKFPDSGVTISYRKVSYNLAGELRKTFPAPEPPIITIDYATGPRQEPNPNDPDYVKALRDYNVAFEERLRRLVIKRGVVVVIGDKEKEEIQKLREDMAEEGITLPTNDQDVYVSYICISTPEDYKDLLAAITRRSFPTEEANAEARERFRPENGSSESEGTNVPGEERIRS